MIHVSLLAALGLMAVHLLAGRLRFIDVIPRSRFLSFSGGLSVAYIFLRILPDLGRSQARVGYTVEEALNIPRDPIYVVALLGLVTFYGVERLADVTRRRHAPDGQSNVSPPLVFWVSIGSYSVVNFAVGYLLVQQEATGVQRLSLFFLAMALWFVVNDYGLRVQHKEQYLRGGRWILSAMILVGWAVALLHDLPDPVLSIGMAFVAGGVVMNVLKEELPRERESRFWAFALGAALYSALLMAI